MTVKKIKPIEQYRVVTYMPKSKYKQVHAKLILMGKTVSGWFREKVDELLNE